MRIVYEFGDIAIVTTKKGRKFVARYAYARGIDYFWSPILGRYEYETNHIESAITDPEVSIEVIGKAV